MQTNQETISLNITQIKQPQGVFGVRLISTLMRVCTFTFCTLSFVEQRNKIKAGRITLGKYVSVNPSSYRCGSVGNLKKDVSPLVL